MQNYHDWQITQVRRWYKGDLAMLYPGFGIRANELQDAINANLGSSGSKILSTGEMQAGNDFARFISGINDAKVIVYCTHIDTPDNWSNESSTDPNQWSPLRWLGWLADKHHLRLRKWGENTGKAQLADMDRTFVRIQQADAMGVVWAFEPELYDGKHATIEQYGKHNAALP
jgi:hypothetical protein